MIDPQKYSYFLPPEMIAQEPAVPRDSSQLLIYNTALDSIEIDTFYNLDNYLPPDSFLVLNKTKVIPSRIVLYKENGGKVKTLFLVNELQNNIVKAMVDRHIEIGQRLKLDESCWLRVIGQDEHIFTFEIEFPKETFLGILEERGSMPTPPYLKHSPLTEEELRQKYQTIFASESGSAAAPTASLHFTERVFHKLQKKGIDKTFVKLHVGAGTFAPLVEKNLVEQRLHTEWYEVDQKTADQINQWKGKGEKLAAVGTTVVRTLESVVQRSDKNLLQAQSGETDIFIFPPYRFKAVDILLTNFHVPKSSLMMLVDAFLEHKTAKKDILQLYEVAKKNQMRFFSFGDAMLIL